VAANPDSTVAYPLFLFAGLLPWNFFANAVTAAGASVVGNQNLITKIYFPRLIIPMSATGASTVDFAVAFGMLLVLMACFGTMPGLGVLMVPLIALGLLVAAMGMGTLLSALTVNYRDFRHAVPFMVQLWMFATPCIYIQDEAALSWPLRVVSMFNPAHGLIVNFRAAVLGTPFNLTALAMSLVLGVAMLIAGSLYFRRVERGFADIV
jgi:lipopolysaccharide transport system permease protein